MPVWGRDASYHQRPLSTRDWNLIARIVKIKIKIMKYVLWTRGVEKELTDRNKNQQD